MLTLNNFGFYGTPQREVVFDLNDFDEATIGPWEWDLKRLVASVNVAGRENGLNRRERAAAVRRCVEGYRFNVSRLQQMGVLDVWYLARLSRTGKSVGQGPIPSQGPWSRRRWPKRCTRITGRFCPRSPSEEDMEPGGFAMIRRCDAG